jgi:hypothetical protein
VIEVIKPNMIREYNLGDYILRESKVTKYSTFVLEAICATVEEKSKTVHFGFKMEDQKRLWVSLVELCIDFKHWQRIYTQMGPNEVRNRRTLSKKLNTKKAEDNEKDIMVDDLEQPVSV